MAFFSEADVEAALLDQLEGSRLHAVFRTASRDPTAPRPSARPIPT